MDREEIAKGCLNQSGWCAKLGSPMYEALLRHIAEDVRAGGPCLAALEPHMPQSRMLAPLLLLSAIHRMVLEGKLPEAAPFYPSVGGHANVDALWPHFLAAVPHAVLPACVQTNEIGRSNALLPGFVQVARHTRLALRLLEIGASAGLNLRWDHFPFLNVPSGVHIAERRGCDLNPIDPALDKSRPVLLSFIWADQTDRIKQFSEVLDIARLVPVQIDKCDAVEWLQAQLANSRPGVATVVFHSVVLPYLTEDGRKGVKRVILEAGSRATAEAPLAWLSLEAGGEQAQTRLTIWPGGELRVIAESSFHGRDVKILLD